MYVHACVVCVVPACRHVCDAGVYRHVLSSSVDRGRHYTRIYDIILYYVLIIKMWIYPLALKHAIILGLRSFILLAF